MTDEDLTLYDALMKGGKYFDAALLVLADAHLEEEQERVERERERKEYYAKLRIERPDLFLK
jgi:hypothetical protein